jgi:hypothetical protein
MGRGVRPRELVQFTHEHGLEQGELAVEEMADARKHDHGQGLRPGPVERCRERHDVVALAMNRPRCRPARAEPAASASTGRRAPAAAPCRHRPGARRPRRRRSRRTKTRRARAASPRTRCARAWRRSRQAHRRPRRCPSSHAPSDLPTPRKLKRTLAQPSLHEGAGDRLHDLVVERAALLRLRVADDDDAARAPSGRSRAHSMRPAGPAISRERCADSCSS